MRDVTFGANEQCAPRELSVMPLMEAWAQQFPQLTALVGTSSLSGDPVQLSYSQFNARVNQLAWLLREQENIRAGSTVAVCLTRSPELVILLWAISKTGAAYCPLDPEWPVQRLTEVLLDLDAPIVVSQPDGHPRLTAALQATNRVVLTTNRLDLHQLILQSARMSKENLLVKVKPTLALWILFSSGTTGQPKASIMSHGGMFNVIKWLHADFPLEKEATLPFKTPYTFDVSTKELYWALTSGACLAVASPEIHKEVDRLPEYLHDNNIVAVHFVPTVLDIVIDECEERKVNLKHLRYVLVGGEAIAPETINRFYRAFENAQLFNWYGPCECHGMTCGLLQPGKKITIGRPIMNTAVYILDANLQEVDPGEPGEIWIGGATVGLGYLNRPEMTREKFRANPYASDLFVQNGWLWMYRTLDMGRKLKSGDFEFLGRVLGDAQVKLNGMRLELEEIEAHLVAHELVKFAAAAVITRGERQMLVAYIVPLRPEFFEDLLSELPGFLNLRVPAAFVPRSYVQLDALPFTSHHKLDRRSLATYSMSHEIEQAREKKEEITSCASTEDQVLAVISDAWRKVLRLQPGSFGTDDKFITVGGDSISAIRIASFCRSQGLQVTVGMVLRHETIQSLADACKTLQRDETAKLPAQKEKEFMIHGPVSLTPIQRWWQSLNFIHPNAWSSTFLFTSVRPVKEESVQKMLLSLVDHHDMLRARVSKSGHLSILPIGDADIHLLLRNVECATKDAMTQVINELPSSLNLTEGPVVSAALITRLDDDTQRLAICIHHMCVDLISWRVIIEDMANLMLGKPLPDKTTSFQQWAALLLERANMERGITWPWKAQPTSTRLTAFPEKIAEATISTRQFMDIAWTDKETQLLLEAAGALEASVLQILLTGFCLAFKDAVGGTSVTIDMEGHGREPWDDRIDLSRTVGWFTTNYPVEFDISGNDRYECLNGVKANLTKVPEKGLLYGIMKYLQQHSSEAHSSEILFNYFGTLDEGDDQVDAQWRMSDERRNGVDSMSGEELWPHRLLVEAALETRRLRAWIAFSPVVTEVELVRELSVKWQLAVMDLVTHATTAPPPTKDAISEAGWDQDRRAALLLDLQPLNLDVADIESILPCTSMQDGMIFGSIMDPSTYMVHWYAEMAKDVDIERLERTWNTIVRRHGALRSRFFAPSSAQPGCYQLVLNPEAPGAFVPITTDVVIQINAEDTFDRLIRAEQVRGFQPGVQPLRATLLTINDINGNTTMHKLLLSMSHVILDGWSLSNLLADLLRSYHSVPLPPTPTYSEIIRHVVTCNQNLALNAEQFWVAKLKDLQPAQDLALPKPAKPPRDNYATFHATFSIALDAIEITRKAKGVTMASLYRAVWAIVLARYTSQDDVCFGVTVSGRDSEMSNIEHAIGMMINTLPFRARVSSDMPFDVFVRAIHQESMSVFEYMQTPLSNLKKWARDSGAVLFRAIFVYENYGEAFEKLDSLFQNEQVVEYSDCSLVLMLRSNPASDVLQCKMLYDARIYDSQYIHTVIDEFAVLVKALEREEMWSQLLKQLPRMSDAGLQQISMLSRGEPALKGPISISQLVYQQADRTPYAIALQDDHWRLTYKEFVEAVDSLALRICELGVLPGNLVALLGTRSCQMVIGVFSIIRAGAGVVPIDAVLYPDARIQVMLQDAGCSVAVCTDITYADKLPEGMNSIVFDGQSKHSISSIEKNELPQLHSQLPLYVVYTSGSTGVPKGVLCKHDSAMNLIMQRPGNLSIRSGDIVLQSLNVSFDGAMWEMLACLCNGGLLVLRSDDIVQSMKKCTVVITTPSLLTSPGLDLDPAMFPKLRLLVLVGEKVSQSIASRWGSGRVELWNGYGPTETTMISHLTRLSPSKTVTVGRPIPGTVSYIVDRDGNRVPVGAIGEILIGGVCVSGGYINQEELNSTKFVCNPWQNEDSYSTLYKSGDYGRWLEDGSVEICGRLDNLLKIRGHRVEVGEIEACMRQLDHPSKKNQRWLSNAVICVQPGRVAKLTAFVTPVVPVDMVRAAMTEKVPSYLIPGRIAAVSEFPRTANGKVDMARLMSELEQNMLRIPEETVMESAAKYDGIDVDAAAATLRNAFATALRLPEADVNPSASFFYLGGDSISALRVVTLCRHAGLQVSIQDIFKLETAYAIASKAVEKVAGSKQIDTAVGTWTTSDTRQAILRKAFANALNLAVHEIDPSTSFFFLGGDSISSLRVVSVCREAGLVISARDLFHYETVNMIAANARGSDLKSECINSDISAVDIVKKAFAAALNIPMRQIDPEASFFYLGGDSISCMHVSSICRDGGLSVSARDIYKYETANAIASIAGQSSTSVRKQPLLRNARHHEGDLDRLPLSPVQRLFFSKNMKNPNYFTQAFYFDVNMAAPINMDLFKTTWSEIERHHDAFRLRFSQDANGNWRQHLRNGVGNTGIVLLSATLSTNDVKQTSQRLQRMLDIEKGPMAVAALLYVDGRPTIMAVLHHLIVDLVSWRIILEDLSRSFRRQPLYQPTCTWEEWVTSNVVSKPASTSSFPVVGISESLRKEHMKRISKLSCLVHQSITLKEEVFCRGAKVDDILLAGLLLSYYRTTGSASLTVDVEDHGRTTDTERLDVSRTIGWFTRISHLTVGGLDDSPQQIVQLVRRLRKEAKERQPSEVDDSADLADISFNYHGKWQQLSEPDAVLTSNDDYEWDSNYMDDDEDPWYSLGVECYHEPSGLKLEFVFDPDRFFRQHIERWLDLWRDAIQVRRFFGSIPVNRD
ncbi:hypothetical protein DFJ77DRAFT_70376 [Powellomyces hirtus]|nr:hypothetical protein DFJ77DRAFT_70376 [Powellomyces hirtus]